MSLKLSTFRCGSPRKEGEGLRLGAVRFLPRGVKKEDYSRLNYFDVWFPLVSPSKGLISAYKKSGRDGWEGFSKGYRKEMGKNADSRHAIRLLSETAKRTPVAIGCYCEEERFCHRTILKELIEKEAEKG